MSNLRKMHSLMLKLMPKYTKINEKLYSDFDITVSQVAILNYLEDNGQQKITDIAGGLNMANSNVSNICTRLEKKGYIIRKRSDIDNRIWIAQLTDKSKKELVEINEHSNKLLKQIDKHLDRESAKRIIIGLEEMDKYLDKLI